MRATTALILLATHIVPCLSTLSVTLAPNEEFCFAFRTPKGEPAHITYVTSSDILPIFVSSMTVCVLCLETVRIVVNDRMSYARRFNRTVSYIARTEEG
jgi:hypothetical protein